MELADRAKMEHYMRGNCSDLDLPPQGGADDSMFDYRVDENGAFPTRPRPDVQHSYFCLFECLTF